MKLTFDYNKRLDEMWNIIGTKLIEKMSDSKKIMQEELKQIQERNRQFYKMSLTKRQLDKFEPDREIKFEKNIDKLVEKEKDPKYIQKVLKEAKEGKKKKHESEIEKEKFRSLKNFMVTLLLYEDTA